jgi:hypothetical protein
MTAHRETVSRSALGFLAPPFAPKPRVGRALVAQVGLPLPSGSEKDMAPVAAFFGGAAQ